MYNLLDSVVFHYTAIISISYIIIKIYLKLNLKICKCKRCLVGKTVIITGGNSGIGFQTALALAARGCKLIIADKTNSEKSVNLIMEKTGNNNIFYKFLDLASLESIRNFADEIKKQEKQLDILINNAGTSCSGKYFTSDGLNLEMQVNHFGPFLLTHLLVDLLKKSSPSRIIFVSSLVAYSANLTVDNLNSSKFEIFCNVPAQFVYHNSKLANAITSKILAQKLREFGVTSNCLHPGAVQTNLFSHDGILHMYQKFLGLFLYFILPICFGKTSEEGAQTSIHLALSDNSKSGKFFFNCGECYFEPYQLKDDRFCNAIYNASAKYVKLKDEERL